MEKLGVLDYVIIVLMLVISVVIGIYFKFTGGRQKTIDEFLMGNKKMKVFPVSVSLMATFMSANALLGTPTETYLHGTQYSLWIFGALIGGLVAIYGFLPVYFDLGINSVNEYLGIRFGSTTRTVVSFLSIIQSIFYAGVVLYSPSLAVSAITGISTWTAAICIACVCTFYCSLGGLKAVLWTDSLQAMLMYTTVLAVIVGGSHATGFLEVFTRANDGGRLIFFNFSSSLFERYTFWNCLIYGFYLTLSAFGASQPELQRILSVGKLKKGQISLILGVIFNNVFILLCFWAGIVLFALYRDCDPILSSTSQQLKPDQLIPLTILKLFNKTPGLSGLCVAGIFSASLSTISSLVNSLTSITIEDFMKPYCKCKYFTDSWMVFTAKLLAIVFGGFCLLFSYMAANFRGIMEANTVMAGMIGGPIFGVFILGLFFRLANQTGALIGLVSGFAFGFWSGIGSFIVKAEIQYLPRSTSECSTIENESINQYGTVINSSVRINNYSLNSTHHSIRHIFPLYEISFLWIPVFGCFITVISGAIASFLVTGCCIKKQDVDIKILSPLVRKLYFKSKSKTLKEEHSEIAVTTVGVHLNTLEETHTKLDNC